MNAKNKTYGSQNSSAQVQLIEKMYDGRKSLYNDKSSSNDRQPSATSCDLFGFCSENSLYESTRIYAKARIADMKVIPDWFYNDSSQ